MRLVFMTCAVLAASAAAKPRHPVKLSRGSGVSNYAFFEFAPASGLGMPATACDGTTPSGAKGEVRWHGTRPRRAQYPPAGPVGRRGVREKNLYYRRWRP